MELKKELLKKRQDIFNDVFGHVKDRLQEYTKTPEYLTFLEGVLSDFVKNFPYDHSVIYVRKQDMKLAEQLKKAYGRPCTVEEDKSMQLGGVKISNKEHGIVADESFETRLSDQHQWFYTNSKLTIDS